MNKRIDVFGNGWYYNIYKKMSKIDEIEIKGTRILFKIERRFSYMKSTGIVRKVDELGRVVIPIELRRTLGIAEKDALEIYVDDERIILKKYKPNMTCQVTGEVSDNNLTLANGKLILSREGAELLIKEIQQNMELETV